MTECTKVKGGNYVTQTTRYYFDEIYFLFLTIAIMVYGFTRSSSKIIDVLSGLFLTLKKRKKKKKKEGDGE